MKQTNDIDTVWSPIERELSTLIRQSPKGECLNFEELMSVVKRRKRAPRYYECVRHLNRCSSCRRTYEELRSTLAPRKSQTVFWTFWGVRLAPAAALGAFLVAIRLLVMTPTPAPLRLVASSETPPPPAALNVPAEAILVAETRAQPPRLNMGDYLGHELDLLARQSLPERLKNQISTVAAKLPDLAAAFVPSTQRSISAKSMEAAVEVKVTAPQDLYENFTIEPTDLNLQIQAATDAPLEVVIIDESNEKEVYRQAVDAASTELRISKEVFLRYYSEHSPRSRASVFRLSVRPVGETSGSYFSFSFRVILSQEEKSLLAWARQHAATQPLLAAGILATTLDRRGEALQILQQAKTSYPELPEIEQWIKNLEKLVELEQNLTER